MKKVTINTIPIDIITEKLQKGEIIYYDDNISYKMINNILCRFEYERCTNIGANLFVSNDHHFIEEGEPIKIEVGKHYKTREGKEAVCYFYNKFNDYPCKFVLIGEHYWISTKENGQNSNTNESKYDIVDYWKD